MYRNIYRYAHIHHQELLKEAAQARMTSIAGKEHSSMMDAVYMGIGEWMVSMGEKLIEASKCQEQSPLVKLSGEC